MSSEPLASALEPAPRVFALRQGQGALVLHATGLRHPRFPRWLGETYTRYSDVTHHSVTSRALRLATRRSTYVFPRAIFADPSAPDELARALVERIAALPAGAAQLERMFAVEKLAARPRPVRLAPLAALLCVAAFFAEWLGGPLVSFSGLFSATLVRGGEWWRLVTANLLHGGAPHLILNVIGLLGIGALVERTLGSAYTAPILAAGAVGGMAAGLWADYETAVGASGVVFALVGALLWLELFEAARLPAAWRVPRDLLLFALAVDLMLSFGVQVIAGAAHVGGLVAGFVACAAVARPALARRRPPLLVWLADGAALFGLSAALVAAGALAVDGGAALAQRARPLAERADAPALMLNNLAWLIATDPDSDAQALGVAVTLAESAVEKTARRDPNVLDTLAEAHFAAGRPEDALRAIDEAIALAPAEPYFREQRRRFTGEREREDRPDSPREWTLPGPEPPGAPDAPLDAEEGLQI